MSNQIQYPVKADQDSMKRWGVYDSAGTFLQRCVTQGEAEDIAEQMNKQNPAAKEKKSQ